MMLLLPMVPMITAFFPAECASLKIPGVLPVTLLTSALKSFAARTTPGQSLELTRTAAGRSPHKAKLPGLEALSTKLVSPSANIFCKSKISGMSGKNNLLRRRRAGQIYDFAIGIALCMKELNINMPHVSAQYFPPDRGKAIMIIAAQCSFLQCAFSFSTTMLCGGIVEAKFGLR